jgi:two-component system chemotaxis response regulator CheB
MPRDVVVVGASSGGLDPLTTLVAGLPANLPAAVFVVVHVRPDVPSHLPAILNRAGSLPAAHAVDGEPIRRGRIYVAPPGFHTYVHRGHIRVARGPQENSTRPAIDPLFRTAAHHYGPRVVGVVLSGALDDGSAGLQAIKNAGGCAIVQDPCDAVFPDMPANACERTEVDYSVPAHELAARVVDVVNGDGASDRLPLEVPLETAEETPAGERALRSEDLGPPSGFTCPDCHGALWEIDDGEAVRYRCRVGHAYSEDAMVSAQSDSVERALWAALRSLEERAALIQKLAENARRRGHAGVAALFDARSRQMDADIKAIHDVITNGQVLEPVGHDGI